MKIILYFLHKKTGIRVYLYCGYVPCGMEYTCVFSGYISEKQPKWWRLFFDGGIKISRNFYEKYLEK